MSECAPMALPRPWLAPLASLMLVPVLAAAAEPFADDAWFRERREDLVGLYKHLHSHPELSFRELNTARRIAEELKKAGADVTTGVGQIGVVGVLRAC